MKEKLGSLLEFLSKIGISKMDKLSKEVYINTIIDINARLLGLKTDVNLNTQFDILIPLKVDKRKNNSNLNSDVRQAILDIFKFKKGEINISYLKNYNSKPYVTLTQGDNELSATSSLLKEIKSDDINTQIYKVFNKLLLKKSKDFKTTHFDLSNTTINDLNITFKKDILNFYLENILTEDKNNPLEFNEILTINISKYDNFTEFLKNLKFSDKDIEYYTERLIKSKININNILDKVYSNSDLHKGLNRLNKTIPKLMLLISEYNKGITDIKNVFNSVNVDSVGYEINEFEKILLDVFGNLNESKIKINHPNRRVDDLEELIINNTTDSFENGILSTYYRQLGRTITLLSVLDLLQGLREIGYQIPNLRFSTFDDLRHLLSHLNEQTEGLEQLLSEHPEYNTRLVTFSPYNNFVSYLNSIISHPNLTPPLLLSSQRIIPDLLFSREEALSIFNEQYDEMMDQDDMDDDNDDIPFETEETTRSVDSTFDLIREQINAEIRAREYAISNSGFTFRTGTTTSGSTAYYPSPGDEIVMPNSEFQGIDSIEGLSGTTGNSESF
jgi:hypothetical protein